MQKIKLNSQILICWSYFNNILTFWVEKISNRTFSRGLSGYMRLVFVS